MTPTVLEHQPTRTYERAWLVVWAVMLFTVTLLLHTRHNTFPFFYHPDEAEKTEQVLTGDWNFHHPMLLLSTTKAGVKAFGVDPNPQAVVVAGRWVSAAFTAGAVLALALLAYLWRGWVASLAAGGALLLHHQLFELAHYMKEDTALLLGLALGFLAAYLFWQNPSVGRAAGLGVAVAVAISGKYLGIVALGCALPLLWLAPGTRGKRILCFCAALVTVLVVINLPLLVQFGAFEKSFGREVNLVVHGQRGLTRSVPHTQYWSVFRDNTTPVIWGLLLVFLVSRWRERRALTPVQWTVIAFPFVFAVALSFSPKTNDRYFLPATALFTLLAGLGVVDAAKLLARWMPRHWAAASCVTLLVGAQLAALPKPLDWRTFSRYFAAFQRDDNAEMLAWVKAELPPDAVIAKDSRVKLPDPKDKKDALRYPPIPHKILAARYAADVGTMEELRSLGVTHLAVSETDYGKFFVRGLRPQPKEAADFARRKIFYEELLRAGEPLFERSRGTVIYLHPGIRLYRLPPSWE